MATVVGLFENTAQAQTAVEQLRSSGIDSKRRKGFYLFAAE